MTGKYQDDFPLPLSRLCRPFCDKLYAREGPLLVWIDSIFEPEGFMAKILTTPRMERCIGCHSCSLACARLVHKRLSWDTAGIRIASSGGLSTGFEARVCLACNPAPCVLACRTGAYAQRQGGGVIIRKNLCTRCGECAKACPVDAIYLDPTAEPFVCLHCGRCIPFCPHDCLEMAEVERDISVAGKSPEAAP